MKFSEIKYERVDLQDRRDRAEELIRRLREAASFEEVEQVGMDLAAQYAVQDLYTLILAQ